MAMQAEQRPLQMRPVALRARKRAGWQARVTSTTPDLQRLRKGARQASLERLIRLRVYFAPLVASFAAVVMILDPTPWRRAALSAAIGALLLLSFVERWRLKKHGPSAASATLNFGVMLTCQVVVVAATGGMFSPIVFPLLMMRFVSVLVLPNRGRLIIDGLLIAACFGLASLHAHAELVPTWTGLSREVLSGGTPFVFAGVISLFVVVGSFFGSLISDVIEGLFSTALADRDRRLAQHEEQSRALSSLSAEIAHELKNPLSTVKGLAGMLARNLSGRDGERMGVLRREVERMQITLEDHLNFARPLVPLGLEDVDLRELVLDVARLFEGVSEERGVDLIVQVPSTAMRCDPRKMRQVMVNLVQNAIDASSPTSQVRVLAEGDDPVRLVVQDEGSGIDASLAERVFEAGVTSKPNGSGIGLVVARSSVRQHGGELVLRNRVDRGCEAVITLPRVAKAPADGGRR